MGEKLTTQRATQVAAGGFPVAVGCYRAIKLIMASVLVARFLKDVGLRPQLKCKD